MKFSQKTIFYSLIIIALFIFVVNPILAQNDTEDPNVRTSGTNIQRTFESPTNATTFSDATCKVTTFFSKTVLPPVAVFMGLVSAFLFMTAGASPQRASAAKKALLFTLIGVVLLLLAPAIVALIANIFGGFQITAISCSASTVGASISDVLLKLVNWFSWFVGILSVVMGLYGGFLFMTSQGDPQKTIQARKIIAFTIIGITVALASFSIITIVQGILGI